MRAVLPNGITALRGLAGLGVAWLVIVMNAPDLAFTLFIGAILTDLVDGWVARRLQATSWIGLWLDPLADKTLMNATWFTLWCVGWAPTWLAGLMVLRDLLVATGWLVARLRGRHWRANLLGRLMLSFEGVALAVLLFRNPLADVHWPTVGVGLGALSLVLAVLSGVQYAVQGPDDRG